MRWLLALLIVGAATASGAGAERPRAAVPFAVVEPSLQPDDEGPAWQNAVVIDALAAPLNATLPKDAPATTVRLLWTRTDLWIRFECEASTITRLPGGATRRDEAYYQADCVEVFLDPVGDGRSYVEIQVSPDNGVFDGLYLHTAQVESERDLTIKAAITRRDSWFFPGWDMVGLRTAARVHLDGPKKGWNAVLAIPAKALLQRLGTTEYGAGMTLRANFLRFDHSTSPGLPPIITNWAAVVRGRAHRSPAGMGSLTLQGPKNAGGADER